MMLNKAHKVCNLRLNNSIEACLRPIYARDIFNPIRISIYKAKQDNHAIQYTSEGNVTIHCILFRSSRPKTNCCYLRSLGALKQMV